MSDLTYINSWFWLTPCLLTVSSSRLTVVWCEEVVWTSAVVQSHNCILSSDTRETRGMTASMISYSSQLNQLQTFTKEVQNQWKNMLTRCDFLCHPFFSIGVSIHFEVCILVEGTQTILLNSPMLSWDIVQICPTAFVFLRTIATISLFYFFHVSTIKMWLVVGWKLPAPSVGRLEHGGLASHAVASPRLHGGPQVIRESRIPLVRIL